MEASYRYFENKECQYYPCHTNIEHINCLFCYCPLYTQENCPGTYQYLHMTCETNCMQEKGSNSSTICSPANTRKIKDCTNCTFPHKAENYDSIIQLLSQ